MPEVEATFITAASGSEVRIIAERRLESFRVGSAEDSKAVQG